MTIGIFLAILAAFLWSITNVLDKVVVSKHLPNIGQLYIPLSVVYIVFGSVSLLIGQEWPKAADWPLIALAAVLWIVMGYTYFLAAKREEISRMVPVFALTPVFVAILGALLLGEIFSFQIYLAIGVIVLGTVLIMFKGSVKSLIQSRVFGLMIISSLAVSFQSVIVKYLLNTYSSWTTYGAVTVFSGLISFVIFIRYLKDLRGTINRQGWGGVGLVTISESNSNLSEFVFILATSFWYVSLVSAIGTIQYLFLFFWALILSRWKPNIIREDISRQALFQKLLAILLIIGGIYLIA